MHIRNKLKCAEVYDSVMLRYSYSRRSQLTGVVGNNTLGKKSLLEEGTGRGQLASMPMTSEC